MEIKNHFRLFYFIFCWFALVREFCFVFDSLPASQGFYLNSLHKIFFFFCAMNLIFCDVEGSIQCSSHRKKSSWTLFYSQKRRKFHLIVVRGSRDMNKILTKKNNWWNKCSNTSNCDGRAEYQPNIKHGSSTVDDSLTAI